MKQKTITLLLCTVIGITVGVFVINSHETKNVNTLLMQNVEALAGYEGEQAMQGNSDCPGSAEYNDTGVMTGEATLRIHLHDSVDRVIVQSYKKCYALGHGKDSGNDNEYFDVMTKSSKESDCLGEQYHKNSFYDNDI